ncbi:M48 family metallopeptidase [bacterium]|nr:M48 family metallopeptidase [bacterium]
MKALRLVMCLPLVAALVSACAIVPETGRKQLVLVSPQEEIQLGLTEFDKLKQNTPVAKDATNNALLQRVGQRIAVVASLPGAQWEFVLFDVPQTPNAFCLPGGKVGVYTGILPITKDEAGLATVIGHEVAHAVARHGGERLSEGLLLQLGGTALSAAMKNNAEATRNIALQAYGIGSQVGVALPHSRSQELEADHIGLLYMARAGYDPQQAVAFWTRFAAWQQQSGSGQPPEFLSTHPVDSRRIAQLEELMPEASREYQKAGAR